MFDVFDSLLLGQRVEYKGKEYMQLKIINAEMIMAVELGAEMPAQVVVIPSKEASTKGGER